ncbi:MAG: hypothetical protein ABR551_02795 [Gemmatimonadales bacterium]
MRTRSPFLAIPILAVALLASACTDTTAPTFTDTLALSAAHAGSGGPGGVSAGLRVWLQAGEGITALNGGPVQQWADQSGNANHAVWTGGGMGELPPLYVASHPAVRGQPTVRFDGASALEIDLTWLAGSDYTIIVVNGRDRAGLANFYIAGDQVGIDRNLVLGYERTDLLRQAHFANDLDAVVEDYSGTEIWSLDTFLFAQAAGRTLYHNGASVATDNNVSPLLSNSGSTLGHFRAIPIYWFEGDLAEVIVYDRALSSSERLLVEAHLAGVYGYALDVNDYVPCTADWGSHGRYVAAHAQAVNTLVAAGVLTRAAGGMAKAAAAGSTCGI